LLAAGNDGCILRCLASGKISFFTGNSVGGLVGESQGVIAESVADVRLTVSGSRYAGGLAGANFGIIKSSYAEHSLAVKNSSEGAVGGLVGTNDVNGQIESSFAAGQMNFKTSGVAGGLIGTDEARSGSVASSYWDLNLGINDPHRGAGNVKDDPGITGLTTEQFQSGLPDGFDPKTWGSDPKINSGYPYLLANPPH
jgi:hypothetical protein